jgi:hypothetical protein
MDPITAVLGIGFPVLLALVTAGASIGFAMTSSESAGFLVAKACFAVAAFDLVAFAIYWVIATRQPMPWNIVIPTILAVVAIPALVLSLQWLGTLEIQLSTRLFPGDFPTPQLPIAGTQIPEKALKVFLGSNVAWATRMPHTILMMGGETMIQIDKDKSRNELVISALKIFDDRNNIIARVDAEDGFWVETSTRKKRPDKSTLVVYDHSDTEVLRIVFMNLNTLYVTGIFRHAGVARPVIITPASMNLGGPVLSSSMMGESGLADIVIGAR